MLKQFLSACALAAGVISMSHAAEAGLPAQTVNERGVKTTVTPRSISGTTETWDFDVVLETHTQNLADDLAKVSMLVADGKQYAPVAWEGSPPGGHHRKGMLRFAGITPPPAMVVLQIRLAGDAAPRNFRWALK